MSIFILLILISLSGFAQANGEAEASIPELNQIDLPDGWVFNIGLTTEAVIRGISVSDEKPAIAGAIQYKYKKNWYGGASGFISDSNSNGIVDGKASSIFVGYEFDFFDDPYLPGHIQVRRLNFHGAKTELDFWEYEIGIQKNFDDVKLGFSISYANEYIGTSESALYISKFIEYNNVDLPFGPLTQDWTLGLLAGHQNNNIDDFSHAKVYFGKRYINGVGIEIAYHDTYGLTSISKDLTDSRVTATISYLF